MEHQQHLQHLLSPAIATKRPTSSPSFGIPASKPTAQGETVDDGSATQHVANAFANLDLTKPFLHDLKTNFNAGSGLPPSPDPGDFDQVRENARKRYWFKFRHSTTSSSTTSYKNASPSSSDVFSPVDYDSLGRRRSSSTGTDMSSIDSFASIAPPADAQAKSSWYNKLVGRSKSNLPATPLDTSIPEADEHTTSNPPTLRSSHTFLGSALIQSPLVLEDYSRASFFSQSTTPDENTFDQSLANPDIVREVSDFVLSNLSHFVSQEQSRFVEHLANHQSQPNAPDGASNAANHPSNNSAPRRNNKRTLTKQDDDEDEDEGDDKKPNKHPRYERECSTEKRLQPRWFACPYYKRFPEKYDTKHSTCSRRGWLDTHRLKNSHLYRAHIQHSIACQKCFGSFTTQDQLAAHQALAVPCSTLKNPAKSFERGVTPELRQRLKDRTGLRHMNEEQKWKHIFHILFPDVEWNDIPDPYINLNQTAVESDHTSDDALRSYLEDTLPDELLQSLSPIPSLLQPPYPYASAADFLQRDDLRATVRQVVSSLISQFRSKPSAVAEDEPVDGQHTEPSFNLLSSPPENFHSDYSSSPPMHTHAQLQHSLNNIDSITPQDNVHHTTPLGNSIQFHSPNYNSPYLTTASTPGIAEDAPPPLLTPDLSPYRVDSTLATVSHPLDNTLPPGAYFQTPPLQYAYPATTAAAAASAANNLMLNVTSANISPATPLNDFLMNPSIYNPNTDFALFQQNALSDQPASSALTPPSHMVLPASASNPYPLAHFQFSMPDQSMNAILMQNSPYMASSQLGNSTLPSNGNLPTLVQPLGFPTLRMSNFYPILQLPSDDQNNYPAT